jgi:hypothetical protein
LTTDIASPAGFTVNGDYTIDINPGFGDDATFAFTYTETLGDLITTMTVNVVFQDSCTDETEWLMTISNTETAFATEVYNDCDGYTYNY